MDCGTRKANVWTVRFHSMWSSLRSNRAANAPALDRRLPPSSGGPVAENVQDLLGGPGSFTTSGLSRQLSSNPSLLTKGHLVVSDLMNSNKSPFFAFNKILQHRTRPVAFPCLGSSVSAIILISRLWRWSIQIHRQAKAEKTLELVGVPGVEPGLANWNKSRAVRKCNT